MSHKRWISMTVNHQPVAAEIECRMTLAEFIREHLGLMGTKVGCNRGECGSCTVLVGGRTAYACSVLAVEADGKEVGTIEGIGEGQGLHPLQAAFVEHDALQCGYCTPGMIVSLKSLLDGNPHPTEADVKRAIDGNLCRCGSYVNIVKAALAVSEKPVRKGSCEG